jgi:hypothetical protein
MMTRLEKILVALLVVWIAQAITAPFVRNAVIAMVAGSAGDHLAAQKTTELYYNVVSCISILSRLVFGYWLFSEAKTERERRWLWCLLGVFGGFDGVIFFYLYIILKDRRSLVKANQLPDPTSPSVTPPAGAGGAPSVAADH